MRTAGSVVLVAVEGVAVEGTGLVLDVVVLKIHQDLAWLFCSFWKKVVLVKWVVVHVDCVAVPVECVVGNFGLELVLDSENEGWFHVNEGWYQFRDTWFYGYLRWAVTKSRRVISSNCFWANGGTRMTS